MKSMNKIFSETIEVVKGSMVFLEGHSLKKIMEMIILTNYELIEQKKRKVVSIGGVEEIERPRFDFAPPPDYKPKKEGVLEL